MPYVKILPILFLLVGCQSVNIKQEERQPCDVISKLTQSYAKSFADIRVKPRDYDSLSIWSTDYQLVLGSCGIWESYDDRYSYVCNKAFPDKESAKAGFAYVIDSMGACKDSSWEAYEMKSNDSRIERSAFYSSKNDFVVASQMSLSRGLFKDSWSVYFFFGNKSLLER